MIFCLIEAFNFIEKKKNFTGNWKGVGECQLFQKQERQCIDGNFENCTTQDKEQLIACDKASTASGTFSRFCLKYDI